MKKSEVEHPKLIAPLDPKSNIRNPNYLIASTAFAKVTSVLLSASK